MGNAIKSFFKKIGNFIDSVFTKKKNVSTVQVKTVNNKQINKNQLYINFSKEFQIKQNDKVRLCAKVCKTKQSQDKSIIDFKDNDSDEISFLSQSTKIYHSASRFIPNIRKGNNIINRYSNNKKDIKMIFKKYNRYQENDYHKRKKIFSHETQ